jgi:hypothetical protein
VSGEPIVLAPLAVLLLIGAIVAPALVARRITPVTPPTRGSGPTGTGTHTGADTGADTGARS